jgi:hypothetical protein
VDLVVGIRHSMFFMHRAYGSAFTLFLYPRTEVRCYHILPWLRHSFLRSINSDYLIGLNYQRKDVAKHLVLAHYRDLFLSIAEF